MKFFFGNIPSVFLMTLVLLANAQRTSNNLKDVDLNELARQNKITTQILEAFIHKKLGLAKHRVKPPSIADILPMKHEDRLTRDSPDEEAKDGQESEDDNLQSVESEQIDSYYSEGRKKYSTPPFEEDLAQNYRKTTFYPNIFKPVITTG